MKTRLLTLLSFASVMVSGHSFAAPLDVTSQDIRGLVEARNAKVVAAKLSAEGVREREGSLKRSFLPSAELYAAQEHLRVGREPSKTQPTYGVEAKVNLYNGGRDRIENEIRSLETKRHGYQSQRMLAEEVEKARTSYWQAIYMREEMALLREAIAVNERNLEAAQKRIRSGVATGSDRVEFEMKAVDLKRDLKAAELRYAAERRNLAVLLGQEDPESISLPEPLAHEHDYQELLRHSMNDHEFFYKENEVLGEQSLLSASSNRRVWWPRLDAYAAYNQFNEREKEYPNASDRTEAVVGLRLSMSLPAGFDADRDAAAQVKEAHAAQTIAAFQKREVESHLATELAELRFLHDQVHDAEENIKRAELYYKLTQSEYSRGVKNSPDVLGASEKLLDMRRKRVEIIKDFQVSKAHVLSKIGK